MPCQTACRALVAPDRRRRILPASTADGRRLPLRENSGTAATGGALYGLGIFGSCVYFWQQADGFWEYVLAVFQGVFWPAFMVYQGFSALD
jgi:hypothetical protein